MGSQQFCLRWNNHQSNMLNVFDQLFQNEALVDVTLACDGLSLKAHKVVLSACSPYFQSLFLDNPCQHPIVFLKDVRYSDLKALVDFMYKGEVNVSQEQLNAVLETAESLKVKGLAEMTPEGPQQGRAGDISYHISKVIRNTASIGLTLAEAPSKDGAGALTSASPPQSPRPAITSSSSSSGQDQTKRCCSPPAKRRKAKPRKRIPENAIPSDHEDSDALDLSTASPELHEPYIDIQDGSYETAVVCENRKTGLVAMHLGSCSSNNNNNNGSSNNNTSNALQSALLHLDVEENVSPHEKDYNSNQNQAQASPSGTTSTQRMPILSKVSPLVSVMAAAPLPSTSATQASIQDMLWSSERRIRSYHCEHCKQTFESKSYLYKHGCPKERVGFTCEVCSSSFPSHSRYLRHREIHNPDRETFTCQLCNKTMVRLDHLRTHMKNLHGLMC